VRRAAATIPRAASSMESRARRRARPPRGSPALMRPRVFETVGLSRGKGRHGPSAEAYLRLSSGWPGPTAAEEGPLPPHVRRVAPRRPGRPRACSTRLDDAPPARAGARQPFDVARPSAGGFLRPAGGLPERRKGRSARPGNAPRSSRPTLPRGGGRTLGPGSRPAVLARPRRPPPRRQTPAARVRALLEAVARLGPRASLTAEVPLAAFRGGPKAARPPAPAPVVLLEKVRARCRESLQGRAGRGSPALDCRTERAGQTSATCSSSRKPVLHGAAASPWRRARRHGEEAPPPEGSEDARARIRARRRRPPRDASADRTPGSPTPPVAADPEESAHSALPSRSP